MATVVYVEEQKMPRSDCVDARRHLDLCCSHMAYGPFSHVAHNIIV